MIYPPPEVKKVRSCRQDQVERKWSSKGVPDGARGNAGAGPGVIFSWKEWSPVGAPARAQSRSRIPPLLSAPGADGPQQGLGLYTRIGKKL